MSGLGGQTLEITTHNTISSLYLYTPLSTASCVDHRSGKLSIRQRKLFCDLIWSSTGMDEVASLGKEFPPRSSRNGRNAPNTPWTTIRRPSASTEPVIFKTSFSLYKFSIILVFATTFPSAISANANFSLDSTSYKCGSNLICLGHAHEYPGSNTTRIRDARLSLIWEHFNESEHRPNVGAGIAYYNQPIRLKDPSTNQSASFSTNFSIDVLMVHYPRHGDGMAFVISADNETLGAERLFLGIFDVTGITSFKSVVVEFDLYQDVGTSPMTYDINDNHVSFDFSNITTHVAASASTVDVELWNNITTYAWVDYCDETQQLEVRVSNNNSRPSSPLLKHSLNLSEVVEEYMWVGFSAGSGDYYSNYYIGDWSFQSSGIASYSSPVRTRLRRKPDSDKLGFRVGLSVPAAFLLACILIGIPVGLYLRWGGRDRSHWIKLKLAEPRKELDQVSVFTYQQLSEATDGFSEERIIGKGGFGAVYWGVLPSPFKLSDTPVAVKVIRHDSAQGEKEFMAEVSIISQLRHRNLIELIGFCRTRCEDAWKEKSEEKYLLVYELMSKGSLDKLLFPAEPPAEQQTTALSWNQRLHIVTRTAAAIDYLHQGWNRQVIHRDIKSSNIMLDENLNPKVGDFGLALLVDHHKEASTTKVAGTPGYLAPELFTFGLNSGRFTDKTDVYAFGVVTLEVACGRRALFRSDGSDGPPNEMLLVDWVWRRFSKHDLLSTADKRLNNNYDSHWMETLLKVGLLCCHTDPLARPAMRQVVQILAGDPEVPSDILANIPTSKPVPAPLPFPVFSSDSEVSLLIDEPSQRLDHKTVRSNSGARFRSTPAMKQKLSDGTRDKRNNTGL